MTNPNELNKVLVTGYVLDPSGAGIPAAKVVYSIINRPKELSGIAIDKTYYSTSTDESGYFEINFIPGLLVKIVIPVTGRTALGVVPFQGPIVFTDLSVN